MSSKPLQPVSGRALALAAVIGLVGGWLVHPIAEQIQGTGPVITVLQPIVLFVIAAVVGITAWATWRQLHVHKERMAAHQAVNRFVLGRACAIVGALLAGGYCGYAVSWLGYADDPLAGQRVDRAFICGFAGLLICVAGLLLERACRISLHDDDEDTPSGATPA